MTINIKVLDQLIKNKLYQSILCFKECKQCNSLSTKTKALLSHSGDRNTF